MEAEPILTHVRDALGRLIEQYKDKDVTRAIIESWAVQVQELEGVFLQIKASRYVDSATGFSLAKIARKVGAPLGDTEDETRLRIKLEIRTLRSSGRADDLIEIIQIAQQAVDPLGSASYAEDYPAGLSLTLDVDDPATIHGYAVRAKAAGVEARSYYIGDDSKPRFRFIDLDPVALATDHVDGAWTDVLNPIHPYVPGALRGVML